MYNFVNYLMPWPGFFFLSFNLFISERERAGGEGKADLALRAQPHAGLDPTTLRS